MRRKWGRGRSSDHVGALDDRAVLVPMAAVTTLDNDSNLSPRSKVKTRLIMALRSDGPDAVVEGKAQTVTAKVPNWLRVVFCYSGSNQGPWNQMPAEVEVAVKVDPATRRIVHVDIDAAVVELDAYRSAATKYWKEDEGPMAGLRGMAGAPRAASTALQDTADTWRNAVQGLLADMDPNEGPVAVNDESDIDALRRSGASIAHQMATNPKQKAKIRASALQAGPMMVDNVVSGAMAMTDLESWLAFQTSSGAITAEEAAAWRTAARG